MKDLALLVYKYKHSIPTPLVSQQNIKAKDDNQTAAVCLQEAV